jgi:hypothetical protein
MSGLSPQKRLVADMAQAAQDSRFMSTGPRPRDLLANPGVQPPPRHSQPAPRTQDASSRCRALKAHFSRYKGALNR